MACAGRELRARALLNGGGCCDECNFLPAAGSRSPVLLKSAVGVGEAPELSCSVFQQPVHSSCGGLWNTVQRGRGRGELFFSWLQRAGIVVGRAQESLFALTFVQV